MAFREVTMLEVKEVLRLWLVGVPKKGIAQQLGFDVKTVRRYLAAAKARGVEQTHGVGALDDELVAAVIDKTQPRTGRPRGEGWAVCEAHREFIERHLTSRVRLTKVGKLLRRRGVEIEYPTLRRFALQQLGFGRGVRYSSSRVWPGSVCARSCFGSCLAPLRLQRRSTNTLGRPASRSSISRSAISRISSCFLSWSSAPSSWRCALPSHG